MTEPDHTPVEQQFSQFVYKVAPFLLGWASASAGKIDQGDVGFDIMAEGLAGRLFLLRLSSTPRALYIVCVRWLNSCEARLKCSRPNRSGRFAKRGPRQAGSASHACRSRAVSSYSPPNSTTPTSAVTPKASTRSATSTPTPERSSAPGPHPERAQNMVAMRNMSFRALVHTGYSHYLMLFLPLSGLASPLTSMQTQGSDTLRTSASARADVCPPDGADARAEETWTRQEPTRCVAATMR